MADVGASAEDECGKRGFARLGMRAAQDGTDLLIMAQGGEGGFGNFVAVLSAEFFVFAEVAGQNGIGRLFEGQHFSQHFGGMVELDRGHGGFAIGGKAWIILERSSENVESGFRRPS